MQIKALALFSGGLDSTLSAKIILDEGIQVEGVYFVNAFLCRLDNQQAFSLQKRVARQLGIKLHIIDVSLPHLEMVQKPRYGYGENMNPCIDCRILMLKQAKDFMRRQGFGFLISGEVLGQRPMSQRRDALNIIDRDADVERLLLRPLSAKRLSPTLPEEKGWVDRNRLFDFSGRSRKPQLALARKIGIKEYSSPAGGCLLTQEEFSRKFRDLLTSKRASLKTVQLLKIGRHFRYGEEGKIIVGRNEQENRWLGDLACDRDILLKMGEVAGPLTVARINGEDISPGLIEIAARVTARYSKGKDREKLWVDFWMRGWREKRSILVSPAGEDLVEKLRI